MRAARSDRRREKRFACNVPVEWAPLGAAEPAHARLVDFSREGVGLESMREVPTRAVIRMQTAHAAACGAVCDGAECPWPRSVAVAEVVWCRRQAPPGTGSYAAGAKLLILE